MGLPSAAELVAEGLRERGWAAQADPSLPEVVFIRATLGPIPLLTGAGWEPKRRAAAYLVVKSHNGANSMYREAAIYPAEEKELPKSFFEPIAVPCLSRPNYFELLECALKPLEWTKWLVEPTDDCGR